jgi:Flp pilus assembly protein TadG
MSHKRTDIREAVKTMLLSNTVAGLNVYSNRVSAFWKAELPSISIFTTEEEATPRDANNKSYVRTMQLRLEVHAEATEDLDTFLDNAAVQVEDILNADQGLAGTAIGSKLTSTSIELAGDASTPVGVLSLNYEIKYIR